MTFANLLSQLIMFLIDNLLLPINTVIGDWGSLDLSEREISIGFGSITWYNATIFDTLMIIIGLMVSITALVLTWKFIKSLTNFVRRMFGGVRK